MRYCLFYHKAVSCMRKTCVYVCKRVEKEEKLTATHFSSIFPNILFALKAPDVFFIFVFMIHPTTQLYLPPTLAIYTHTHIPICKSIVVVHPRWNTHAGEPPVGFCFCFRRVRDVLFLPTVTANTRNLTATKNTKTKIFRFLFILFYIKKKKHNQQQQNLQKRTRKSLSSK